MVLKNTFLLSLAVFLASCGRNDDEAVVSSLRKDTRPDAGQGQDKEVEIGLTSSLGRLDRAKLKGALVGVV